MRNGSIKAVGISRKLLLLCLTVSIAVSSCERIRTPQQWEKEAEKPTATVEPTSDDEITVEPASDDEIQALCENFQDWDAGRWSVMWGWENFWRLDCNVDGCPELSHTAADIESMERASRDLAASLPPAWPGDARPIRTLFVNYIQSLTEAIKASASRPTLDQLVADHDLAFSAWNALLRTHSIEPFSCFQKTSDQTQLDAHGAMLRICREVNRWHSFKSIWSVDWSRAKVPLTMYSNALAENTASLLQERYINYASARFPANWPPEARVSRDVWLRTVDAQTDANQAYIDFWKGTETFDSVERAYDSGILVWEEAYETWETLMAEYSIGAYDCSQ